MGSEPGALSQAAIAEPEISFWAWPLPPFKDGAIMGPEEYLNPEKCRANARECYDTAMLAANPPGFVSRIGGALRATENILGRTFYRGE